MRNRPTGFWQALEAFPWTAAVKAEWQICFGNEYSAAQRFLRATTELASSYPCMVEHGCGCYHDVVMHAPNDIVAVCRCDRGCESFILRQSDIVIYKLNRRLLDATLARVFGLFEEIDSTTDLAGTTSIGIYSPYAGYRFPVYLTIQIESYDFIEVLDGLLGRNSAPFILLAPTRSLCSAKAEKRLTDRGSQFVALSESVVIGDNRQLRLLHPHDEILSQFREVNLPATKEKSPTVFFPTPPDATWSDVSIRFSDGHTVSIKAKSTSGVFNYTQMGMANKKNGNPTVQWNLLRIFANERGMLQWGSKNAHRLNQKRRELLAANLREFFRIEGDPFRLTDNGKGWQARFLISLDE